MKKTLFYLVILLLGIAASCGIFYYFNHEVKLGANVTALKLTNTIRMYSDGDCVLENTEYEGIPVEYSKIDVVDGKVYRIGIFTHDHNCVDEDAMFAKITSTLVNKYGKCKEIALKPDEHGNERILRYWLYDGKKITLQKFIVYFKIERAVETGFIIEERYANDNHSRPFIYDQSDEYNYKFK